MRNRGDAVVESSARTLIPSPVRRLAGGLFFVYTAIYIPLSAISVIYLPSRVAQFTPDDKVGALALVTTVSSLVVMAGQPVVGALSDRGVGRFGRRVPWMLVGALCALVAIPALGAVQGILALGVVWVLCELSLNAIQAPAAAVMVDRVPERRRGIVSGVTGAGFLTGSAIGAVAMGGVLFGSELGVWVLCLVPVAGVLVFLVLAPERRTAAVASASRRTGWRPFSFYRRAGRDFIWAFVSRALITLAYSGLVTYLLYIAQDHLGLPDGDAAALAGVLVVVLLACSLPSLVVAGIVSDRLGRRKLVIATSALIMAAALAIPLLAPNVPGVIVFAAVFGLGYGGYSSVSKALSTLVLPDAERGAATQLGVFNIASVLPQVAAPGLAWLVVTVTGGYTGLFGVSIVLTLAGAAAILFVRSRR